MDSGPDNVTSTSNTAPWANQEPYLLKGFQQAENLYNAPGPQYWPGQQVAPFSPEQTQSQQLGVARATNGSPLNAAASGYLGNVLGGNYLNENPNTNQVYQGIQSRVMPTVNSQFSASGRYGSDLHGDTMTRALSESLAPYMFQNYSQERGMQQQAAGMAPNQAMQDYVDISNLGQIGAQKQGQAQSELDAQMQKFAYEQNIPYDKLMQYMSTIGGNYGGTTTSQQPYYQPSPFSQVAGGLLGLGGLFA